MDINKAIRKQNKSLKRFLLSMCFIFLLLPFILFSFKVFSLYIIFYLIVLEILILIVIFIKVNSEYLVYKNMRYKIQIKIGVFGSKLGILCDKIVLVDIVEEENWYILLISKSNFRNSKFKNVDISFISSHPYTAYYYNKIKTQHPEDNYFYYIIKTASLKKYELLNIIYQNSVLAVFTDNTINKIKEYRK